MIKYLLKSTIIIVKLYSKLLESITGSSYLENLNNYLIVFFAHIKQSVFTK